MAGRAVAHADEMPSDGKMAKLRVEGGDAADGRRGILADLAQAAQRRLRQIMILLLDTLQDADELLPPAPALRHQRINHGQVEGIVIFLLDDCCHFVYPAG